MLRGWSQRPTEWALRDEEEEEEIKLKVLAAQLMCKEIGGL